MNLCFRNNHQTPRGWQGREAEKWGFLGVVMVEVTTGTKAQRMNNTPSISILISQVNRADVGHSNSMQMSLSCLQTVLQVA